MPAHTNSLHSETDIRLAQIVRLLMDHPMVLVSGTKVAEELGTSRSEVWRLIEHLRDLGVQIEGHPTEGYRLASIPELLLPEVVAPRIEGTLFADHIHHHFRTDSTNLLAMQAAAAGAPEGTTFIAETQSAGKGRGGHTWESASSVGIYVSTILRPALAPADVLVISLAAGLAVSIATEEVIGIRPDLRWPNDVLFGEKKYCGILTELNAEATRVRYVVVGIGINVNQERFDGELADIATSIRIETGREWSRLDLLAALLKSLDQEYRALKEGTASAHKYILHRFEQRSSFARRKQVHVEEDGGYDGVTEGLDARGFLQVRTTDGLRTVLSGGVRKRESKGY